MVIRVLHGAQQPYPFIIPIWQSSTPFQVTSLWVTQHPAPVFYLFPFLRVFHQTALAKVLSLPLSSALLKSFFHVFVQCLPKRHFAKVTQEEQSYSSTEKGYKPFEVQDKHEPQSSSFWIKLSQILTKGHLGPEDTQWFLQDYISTAQIHP